MQTFDALKACKKCSTRLTEFCGCVIAVSKLVKHIYCT